jgi:hypothetical protein
MLQVLVKIYFQLHRVFKAVDLGSGRGATVLGLALLLKDFTKTPGVFMGIERDFGLFETSLELQRTVAQTESEPIVQVTLFVFILL